MKNKNNKNDPMIFYWDNVKKEWEMNYLKRKWRWGQFTVKNKNKVCVYKVTKWVKIVIDKTLVM